LPLQQTQKENGATNMIEATNIIGDLNECMCSIVFTGINGATPMIVARNVESFGPGYLKKLRGAAQAYLGKGVRIDWSNSRAERDGAKIELIPNRNIKSI
jgi:hypothetical protein